MILLMFFGLLLLVLLVVGAMAVFRLPSTSSGTNEKVEWQSKRLRILADRYARGKISRDEYLEKLQDISGQSPVV